MDWSGIRPYLITIMICAAILGHGWLENNSNPSPDGPVTPSVVSKSDAQGWAKDLVDSYAQSAAISATEVRAGVSFDDAQKHLEDNFKTRRQDAFSKRFSQQITAVVPEKTPTPTQAQKDWMANFLDDLGKKVGGK